MKFLVPLFLALVACGGAPEQPASPAAPEPTPTATAPAAELQHAPAGYVPGSHDDWCPGHDVPESQCTRCNPDLIPAFQALGDWCSEHGLPSSQCKTCNPDLVIERPPREG